MPVPLKFLFIAAELAQNEKAQGAAKAVWNAGTSFMAKRKTAEPPRAPVPPPVSPPAKPRKGFRAAVDRRMKFRNGQEGDLIAFTYTDEHGLATERMVGNWRCEGGELIGYCLHRKEETAFTVQGISDWRDIPVGKQ